MNESPTRRFRGDTTGDEGYILMLSTLLLVPLILVAAFAIDLGSWYLQANRLQRAADAAALAGVIWQPDFGLAQAEALDIAGRNGFTNGVDDITITVTDIDDTQLRVEIVDNTVPTFFSQIIRPHITIGRASTAEYVRPIPMGSPENFLLIGDTGLRVKPKNLGTCAKFGARKLYDVKQCEETVPFDPSLVGARTRRAQSGHGRASRMLLPLMPPTL